MHQSHLNFDRRVSRLGRKHTAMARGYVHKLQPNGLVIARPKRRAPRVSPRGVVLFIAGIFVFKALLIAHLGEASYEERVAVLQAGSLPEQAGAIVMQVDPVSRWLALEIGPVLR